MNHKISIVVLVWNGERFVEPCLSAVLAQDYEDKEVIVVDNASTDGSVDLIRSGFPGLRLILNEVNLGYATGNNVGIAATTGDVVVLLNQDTEVRPDWLAAIAETFRDPTVGVVGCKALYPDGRTIQHAGVVVRAGDAFTSHIGQGEIDQGQYDQPGPVSYVTGASLAIHRRVLDRLGGLDEGFGPAFYEDLDYCDQVRRAGFQVVYQPQAVLVHHETTSLPENSYPRVAAWHRNRVHYILRQWPAGEITGAFAQAESKAIDSSQWLDDAVARARSYWDNLVALPFVAGQREQRDTLGTGLTAQQTLHVAETLQTLRLGAMEQGDVLIAAADRDIDLACRDIGFQTLVGPGRLRELGESMNTLHMLPEHRFASSIPVLGPLVARFRELWLSVAARWYVFPVIQQQSTLNAQIIRSFGETANQLESVQSQFRDLRHRYEILRDRMDKQYGLASADDASVAAALRTIAARLTDLENVIASLSAVSARDQEADGGENNV